MKLGSTLFLRAAVLFAGLVVLALCVFWVPHITGSIASEFPEMPLLRPTMAVGLYIASAFFFCALYLTLTLLKYIEKGTAFSELSVKALKRIKACSVGATAALVLVMPAAYFVADVEDAPGIIIIAACVVAAPLVVAVFASVLQRLLQEAIRIKDENDLTV